METVRHNRKPRRSDVEKKAIYSEFIKGATYLDLIKKHKISGSTLSSIIKRFDNGVEP